MYLLYLKKQIQETVYFRPLNPAAPSTNQTLDLGQPSTSSYVCLILVKSYCLIITCLIILTRKHRRVKKTFLQHLNPHW